MFSYIEQTIVLLRHAKAIKNEQNRHGGKGSELVEGVSTEIQFVSNQLLQQFSTRFDYILYTTRTQCEQTAKKLGKFLNTNIIELQGLDPISLGIVEGMSEDEVAKLYPQISIQLRRWRNLEIEINQLSIPQMTDCNVFFNKGKTFIENIITSNKSTIIVTSRSILVLLANILLGNDTQIGGGYREIIWGNLEFLAFSRNFAAKDFRLTFSTLRT
jgi:broad specificity phosphatase PhoE